MYRNRVRPLLALLLLVLASLACIPGTERVIGEVTCVDDGYLFGSGTQYICYCPTDGKAYRGGELSSPTLRGIDPARLKTLACSDPFAQTFIQDPALDLAPTEPPTEAPTEASASTEAPTDPAPLKPYLTGAFTACDNTAGYVNFSIAENAPAYDPATFKVTFNGYPVNCAPAANNPSVLTCNYPPPSYAPPAGVQVFIGEELVNEFDFNGGAICDSAPQPNNPGSEDPQLEQPASTEPAATEPSSD
ncbi:MAG: hypothetical protein IPG80_10950 [Anaerolineales bacterium]|uniref:hypothetical protein n=1 Tax=Candidatus Villigracilis vicinus TaxID=3140679 RepID=UPI003137346A|nr:hypothetical protein [Anaerolineales bacterium]